MTTFLNKLKLIIPLGIFLSIAIFLWRGLSMDPSLVPSVLIDKPSPELNLPTLEGKNISLTNKIFIGHVSLLNVWATWCESCAEEHSTLVEIAAQKQVQIYGLDYKDNRQQAIQYLKQNLNPYNIVGFDSSGDTAINWGVYGTPETFIIDKLGIIRYKQIGPITQKIWRKKLLPIITRLQAEGNG